MGNWKNAGSPPVRSLSKTAMNRSTMWSRFCVGPDTFIAAWIAARVPRYTDGVNCLNVSPSADRRATTISVSVVLRALRSTLFSTVSCPLCGTC